MSDRNLICFFSWGRKDLTEASFKSLLESKRPQDKILVIDQEQINYEFFIKYRDKIDYLFFMKKNYHISPIYMLIKNFSCWFGEKHIVYRCEKNEDVKLAWQPDYINIIENDTIGKKGWIDRVLKGFELDERIKIVSGYNGLEHPAIDNKKGFLLKDVVCGVNMIIETSYFIELVNKIIVRKYSMDWKISEKNKAKGNLVAVLPGEIIHTGILKRKKK